MATRGPRGASPGWTGRLLSGSSPGPVRQEGPKRRRWLPGLLATVGMWAVPASGMAQTVLLQHPGFELELTGYVQSLSGAYRPPDAFGGEWSGIHGGVVRLGWTGRIGDHVVVEVHDRLLVRMGSGADPGVVGVGVSVVPDRAVDLRTTLLEGDDLLLWHDLDRLSVTIYTSWADVTLGRQAVTWGSAALFPVADLWGRFSPFELDTQQKPGVDAARALLYPAEDLEVDLVVADAGGGEGASAAGHLTWSRGWGDVRAGAGKFWDEAILLGGVTRVLETTNLRLEAAFPWQLEEGTLLDPRVTLGIDRIGVRWSWTGEVHLNGLGAHDPSGYPGVLEAETLARGESYLLGRWYAGGLMVWTPDEDGRLRLALTLQRNLEDGSTALFPAASYDLGQSGRLILGALWTAGEDPRLITIAGSPLPVVDLRSEFGSYGQFGYLQMALYF